MSDSNTPSLFDESLRRVSGIYAIQHLSSKKVYIGSTNDLYLRRQGHFSTLERKCHKNEYLQNAYNKYGRKAFRFIVVEECAIEQLIPREQYWIDAYAATNPKKGYNIAPLAGGRAQSAETRAKISKSIAGRVRTKEHRRNLSKANKGPRPWTRGTKRTAETRRKMSLAMMGNKNFAGKTHNEAWLKKMRGRKVSEETKRKMSEAQKGKKMSTEARLKMSLAAKARWARKTKEESTAEE